MGIQLVGILFSQLLRLTGRLGAQRKDGPTRSVMITHITRNTTQEDVDVVFLVGEGDGFGPQIVLRRPVLNTNTNENIHVEI